MILAFMYFVFGFVSWINAILIPYFKITCELETHFEALLVTFAFYSPYFIMSLMAGLLLKKIGSESLRNDYRSYRRHSLANEYYGRMQQICPVLHTWYSMHFTDTK